MDFLTLTKIVHDERSNIAQLEPLVEHFQLTIVRLGTREGHLMSAERTKDR